MSTSRLPVHLLWVAPRKLFLAYGPRKRVGDGTVPQGQQLLADRGLWNAGEAWTIHWRRGPCAQLSSRASPLPKQGPLLPCAQPCLRVQ